MAGYIKIHRKLLEWGWYSVPCVKDVFIHLLIIANYDKSEYRGITIERGQAVFGLDSLSQSLGYSIKQIRTAIDKLKKTGEITVWTNRQFSVATIKNYSEYQDGNESDDIIDEGHSKGTQKADEGQTKGKRRADEGHSKGTQRAVSKEIKKERNKEIYTYVLDEFNRICQSLPKAKTLNATRRGRIERAQDQLGTTPFAELFERVEASDFLTGKVKDWRADFDWVLKPEHLTKILEGSYDNRAAAPSKGRGKGSIYSSEGASFDISKYENSSLFDD